VVLHKFFFYQVLRTAHEIQFRVTFRVPVRNSLSLPYNFNVYHSRRIICIPANPHKTFWNQFLVLGSRFALVDTAYRLHRWLRARVRLHSWTQSIDYTDDRWHTGPSTDESAGAWVLFPVTTEKYRQSAVPAVKIWNVFMSPQQNAKQNQIIKDD